MSECEYNAFLTRVKKWGFTDNELCDCGEIQTMSHIVNSCPLTKFDGGLLRYMKHEAAVDWLTTWLLAHDNNNNNNNCGNDYAVAVT